MTLTAEKVTEINRAYLNGHGARKMVRLENPFCKG